MESRMQELYELKDELREELENYKMFQRDMSYSSALLQKEGDPERTEAIVRGFENQLEELASDIENHERRLAILDSLLSEYEKGDRNSQLIDEYVSLFLNAVNIDMLKEEQNSDVEIEH